MEEYYKLIINIINIKLDLCKVHVFILKETLSQENLLLGNYITNKIIQILKNFVYTVINLMVTIIQAQVVIHIKTNKKISSNGDSNTLDNRR